MWLAQTEAGIDASMVTGGVWLLTGGIFLAVGRGLPLLALGRGREGGFLGLVATVTSTPLPIREGRLVRARGALYAACGILVALFGSAVLQQGIRLVWGAPHSPPDQSEPTEVPVPKEHP